MLLNPVHKVDFNMKVALLIGKQFWREKAEGTRSICAIVYGPIYSAAVSSLSVDKKSFLYWRVFLLNIQSKKNYRQFSPVTWPSQLTEAETFRHIEKSQLLDLFWANPLYLGIDAKECTCLTHTITEWWTQIIINSP